MTKTQKTIIVVKSDMKGGFAPSAWGEFASIKDAETFGKASVKASQWRVANEITRSNGRADEPDEVTYEFVSPIFNPRYVGE